MNELRERAKYIVQRLRGYGYKAYFVGGCVRDMVMGNPVKDYDIATDAPPGKIQQIFKKTVPVGEQFGVILVCFKNGQFEVATFRKDMDYTDGRHPGKVVFSTEKEDVQRRDFTINGLFYDPENDRIIDYVNGLKDIKGKIIRTISDPGKRFMEDKLRVIRAIRFACQFDFKIEPSTWKALTNTAHLVAQVSMERIRDELVEILTGKNPVRGIKLLGSAGILELIIPEVWKMKGVNQPPEFHPEGDVFIHTMIMLELMETPSIKLALSILLHDVGKPLTYQVKDRIRFDRHDLVGSKLARIIMRRLKFPNKLVNHVSEVVKDHMKFMHVRNMRESTLKRFMSKETFPTQLELHKIDCLASHRDITNWEYCVNKLSEYGKKELRPPRILTGDDLIKLKFKPGPIFSKILRFVEDAQLEGKIKTREEAVSLVLESFPTNEKC